LLSSGVLLKFERVKQWKDAQDFPYFRGAADFSAYA
jgi:hypothetical protein